MASGRYAAGSWAIPDRQPELPPIERVDDVVEYNLDACRRCVTLRQRVVEDRVPLRHQLKEILPITPLVI